MSTDEHHNVGTSKLTATLRGRLPYGSKTQIFTSQCKFKAPEICPFPLSIFKCLFCDAFVFSGLLCASGQSLHADSQDGCSSAALPQSGLRPTRHQLATCGATEDSHIASTMLSGRCLDLLDHVRFKTKNM